MGLAEKIYETVKELPKDFQMQIIEYIESLINNHPRLMGIKDWE
ncbi:hypothetical protein [Thermovenabulum sp.]